MNGESLTCLILTCLAACCGVMVLVWAWAYKIKNAGVVDIFWSYNFPLIAFILLGLAPGDPVRKWWICGMVIVAGLRLGTHLLVRVVSHIDEEEGRYKQLRKDWAPHASRKFYWFFQFQAISNVLLAIPFFIITSNRSPTTAGLSVLEYAGIALWIISIVGESLADRQLQTFKRDPKNKGQVCDVGLWAYSRHPNYFFQWLMWMAYFVFALASPYGYLAVISPAIILYLLLRVTGIPATEEQSIRSKGHLYRAYQQKTSAFVPWWRKGNRE